MSSCYIWILTNRETRFMVPHGTIMETIILPTWLLTRTTHLIGTEWLQFPDFTNSPEIRGYNDWFILIGAGKAHSAPIQVFKVTHQMINTIYILCLLLHPKLKRSSYPFPLVSFVADSPQPIQGPTIKWGDWLMGGMYTLWLDWKMVSSKKGIHYFCHCMLSGWQHFALLERSINMNEHSQSCINHLAFLSH